MPDDPVSPPASDVNANQTSDIPNRPEPASDLSAPASESASAQPEVATPQDQSAIPASEPTSAQPAEVQEASQTPEPSQAPQAPVDESMSMSTSPVIEPSGVAPPAQEVPPETEPVKEENQPIQANTEPQNQSEAEAIPPQNPEPPPVPSIPSLHFPFYGDYPVTFEFGAQPTDENIKKKYQEWGIIGHNGLDFGLPEGTEVLACDEGVVTQAGDNGDFGISITIKHSWGTSIYCHLQSFGVLVNDHVTKTQVIGLSGKTGFVTGPHLHFGIQPTNPNANNDYLGYINPTRYLMEKTEKQQVQPQPEPQQAPDLPEEKPVSPQSPQQEAPQPDIQQQVEAMFDARIKENSMKGNQAKKEKRDEAVQKIYAFAQEKKRVTNEQIRDLLHISQSTASDYLSDLVNRGMLKVEGNGKATVYLF